MSVVRRILASAVGVLAVGTVLVPASGTVHAGPLHFGLVDQEFNVAADGRVRLTLSLPVGMTPPTDGFLLKVTALQPVETREDVANAVAGDLPGEIDSVSLVPFAVPRPTLEQMQVDVPVEVTTLTDGALQMSRPGVYPLHIELEQGDEVTTELLTFVHRYPSAEEGEETPMPVAMAMSTASPVTLDDQGGVVLDAATRRELTSLADLLEASAIPIAVRIPPSQLAALAAGDDADAALGDRLRRAMDANDLLSSPILPLDVSLAADAGEDALYTQWLRDGEDQLANEVDSPAQRTLAIVDQPLSQRGGLLLRNLGTRMVVMPGALYDTLPGTLGGFTDTTQLVQIDVGSGATVDAAIVDRLAAPALERLTTEPTLHAVQMVADLLAARQQVEDQGGDPSRHSIMLGTTDLSLPSPTGFAAFTAVLADTPGLRAVTLDELSARTDQLLGPEGPVVVGLPDDVEGDLAPRMDLVNSLSLESVSTGSMLPQDDARLQEWARIIQLLPTSALADDQADRMATDMRAEFAGIRSAVTVPAGFSFRLAGTTGSIPVTLRNDADIPITVRVRMSSPKLRFPEGDETVVLEPNAFTEVKVDIVALSNGEFTVTLDVFTPLGDVRLSPPVLLTARINALSGLANLLTGAALLVLLTWWVRHIRRNRRNRRAAQAAEAAERHPALREAPAVSADDPGTPGELSPDAATSTLPPS